MKQRYQIGIAGCLLIFLGYTDLVGQNFVLNGSASFLGGSCYQLTPDVGGQAGSFFSENPIDLTQPFTEDASFFFGCKDGNGADGIVFILSTSNTALGIGGGGIGYEGITPSIAVEYDDYQNGNYGDPSSDHMAIISMGSVNHNLASNLVGPINLSNIEDCMDHCFTIDWNPANFTLTAVLDGNTISYTGDIVTTIFSGNSQVYYGFSSGTGGLSNIHRVCFGPPALEPMADVSVCEGEGVILEADPNGTAWTWAPDPTLSDLDISNPIATPTATTTYTTVIEYSCGYVNYDTVLVNFTPAPTIEASNNSPVCIGETLNLMADGGNSYQWSGPLGFTSSSQNPTINSVSTGMAGLYTVTVTDVVGCSAVATTLVIIDLGPQIIIDPPPDPLCENNDPIQMTASPSGGTWDGDITIDGIFDPAYAGSGNNIVSYTSTNSNGCSNTEQINIEVLSIPDVFINTPGLLCESGNPIQMSGSPIGGYWEGEITLNGIFDPETAGSGQHLITYIANDGNGCTNSAVMIVEVVAVMPVSISPLGPFCITDSIIILNAIPPDGQWGGVANPLGQVFPGNLGAGLHLVIYELINQSGCFFGQEDIEILNTPLVTIDTIAALCLDLAAQTLTGSPAGGTWSGAANVAGQVDPAVLGPGSHQVIYTYTLQAGCTDADTSNIIVLPAAPIINTVNTSCDSLATAYVVSFTITGGDPLSYSIMGSVPGTLIPGNPYIFTSQPILSGASYSFIADDINHCDPDTITGSYACNCATNAGMLDLAAIAVCEDDTISVTTSIGAILDPNDTLVYVLHLGIPDSIILVSNSNQFSFGPPLQTGVTYFISAVAGNALSAVGVDLADPCLSVSFGTPVMWVSKPTGFLVGPSMLCSGDRDSLVFMFSDSGPYDIVYTTGTAMYSIDSISSGYSISIMPDTTTIFTLLQVSDPSVASCSGMPNAAITVVVHENKLVQTSTMICSGDSILLDGTYQIQTGIYVDSLTTIFGCDSIVKTNLTVLLQDTTYLDDTSCDPTQTGIFVVSQMNQYGCDSIIITTVTFAASDTTTILSFTCDQQDTGIFTQLLIAQDGCDSLVIETIEFIPSDTTMLSATTCDTASAGTFIRILSNAAGCDSLIIEMIQFTPADTTMLSGETCDPVSAGTFTHILFNADGCDSLVIETILLQPSNILADYVLTCFPEDTGTIKLVYTNIYGCDSIIFIITSLAPYDSCHTPVIPKNIFIPNVFSPNGDDVNDVFLIFSNSGSVHKISYLRIFDRWGGLVLEQFDIQPNDPQVGWDGTEKGYPLSPGVFVWTALIEYTDGKQEIITGNVTLIR